MAVGVAVALAVAAAQNRLARRIGQDPGSQILISPLLPFGAYLAAEEVHGSGILAAVAAGIATNYVEIFGRTLATVRMRRRVVWDAVQFTANGVIFVLLGEQLPSILSSAVLGTVETGI
jgi:CPA1 family monovalent cation:H+ antiporter